VIVRYQKRALKALRRIQPKLAANFTARLEAIASAPHEAHPNVKKLSGADGLRLRIGDWRAIYWINTVTNELIVETIEPRGGVYK
jgi:mRNA interferase RelE/StbE